MSKFKDILKIIEEGLLKSMSDADVKQVRQETINEFHSKLLDIAERLECKLIFKSVKEFTFKYDDNIDFNVDYRDSEYITEYITEHIEYFIQCIYAIRYLAMLMKSYNLEYGKDWIIAEKNKMFYRHIVKFVNDPAGTDKYWSLDFLAYNGDDSRRELTKYLNAHFPKKK